MQTQGIKKIVLAYSGGLDTSAIIPWLKENYGGCEGWRLEEAEEQKYGERNLAGMEHARFFCLPVKPERQRMSES